MREYVSDGEIPGRPCQTCARSLSSDVSGLARGRIRHLREHPGALARVSSLNRTLLRAVFCWVNFCGSVCPGFWVIGREIGCRNAANGVILFYDGELGKNAELFRGFPELFPLVQEKRVIGGWNGAGKRGLRNKLKAPIPRFHEADGEVVPVKTSGAPVVSFERTLCFARDCLMKKKNET